MNILRPSISAATALLIAASGLNAQTTATTIPVGFVTVDVAAGLGSAKRNTLLSIPLLESEAVAGQVAGFITAVTSNTLVNTNAGWTPGALSDPQFPYVIQIASGAAAGRMFLITSSNNVGGAVPGTANTATNVTVSPGDVTAQGDLTTLGISPGTDTYRIFACDTIGSLLGNPPSGGVLGGSNAATSDTLVLSFNGVANTYFYSTNLTRWARVAGGSPDSGNVALVPNYGIQYQRLPTNSLSLVPIGQVPDTNRQVSIKNSGVTFLSQFWPAQSTVSTLGLQSLPGWLPGSNATVSDNIITTTAGSPTTYFYDGTNWRRVAGGSPIANTNVIAIGSTIQVVKKGTNAGFTTLNQALPYNPFQ
jgi:hypothetical protein